MRAKGTVVMIDWAHVLELRDEIGQDDFEEVVELFLEEVQEVIDRLTAGADPATLEADMHFLKGSALNLGFQEVSTLCADAEKLAAQGQHAAVDLPQILGVYDASRAQFLNEKPQKLSA